MRTALAILVLALSLPAWGQDLPANAKLYLPRLIGEIDLHWPMLPLRSALGAQVEQETCISLTSKRCWSPTTELKTDREYGFGLGQLTVTSKFNAFDEVKALDPSLRSWKWEDRYNPDLQLRALVLKDRYNFERFKLASTPYDQLVFAVVSYNGGVGGTLNDIKLCARTEGCDSGRWFGHVERTSLKSRTKWKGYGQSAFDINRGYARDIFGPRRPKYIKPMGDAK